MKKKDILELKRRLKKDECTFTKMCGCYVDGEKNVVLKLNETFLNLEDEEYFKYLEIAKKTLSGTVGNNLLELEFPFDEEEPGGRQHSLMALKKSQLKDESLLDSFYNLIIESYDYTGNFLILLFYDAYDVMRKTSDNSKLDESEEVYEYIICSICPVSLSKAGLGYFEDDNRIGARVRDWVVEAPSNGFIFPAFTDRSSDIHSVMYYTKNAKDSHPELMEEGLGCSSKQTATEQKETFTTIIKDAIGIDDVKSDPLFMEIQENLNSIVDEHNTIYDKNAEPVTLTNKAIQNILLESGIPEEITAEIEKTYTQEFGDTPPVIEHLIDSKALAANEQRKKEQELEKQVQILQNKLEITMQNASANSDSETNPALISDNDSTMQITPDDDSDTDLEIDSNTDSADLEPTDDSSLEIASDSDEISENESTTNFDIVLKVKPQKIDQIKSQIIDGKKYIVIPIDNDEQANVNGVPTTL